MPKSRPDVVCIYCLTKKPPSKAHLLQRALGGDQTGFRVCGDCNRGFSVIDEHLADNALVSLVRVAEDAHNFSVRMGGSVRLDSPDKTPMIVRNGYVAEVMPQLLVTLPSEGDQAQVTYMCPSVKQVSVLQAALRTVAEQKKPLYVEPDDSLSPLQFAVRLYRGGDAKIAVGSKVTPDRANRILASLGATFADAIAKGKPEEKTIEKPQLLMSSEFRPNDVFRAVAKTSFNLLSDRTPEPFVLRRPFHPLRDYIRGDVRIPGDGEFVDGRFVSLASRLQAPVSPTDAHTVTLLFLKGWLESWVVLYRQLVFRVRLGRVSRSPWEVPQVVTFAGDRRRSRWLSLEEVAALLRNDHALGTDRK